MPEALIAPSGRDLTRTYMIAQLEARNITGITWTSTIPATRPQRFFTIEDLNTATTYGHFADSQLIQIRGYDSDYKRCGETMRLVKGLWAAMPSELKVQDVEHAGGPAYDQDPDVPGLWYGQLIAWVTVMTKSG